MKRNALLVAALVMACAVLRAGAADAPALPQKIDLDTALSLARQYNFAIRQARARYKESEGAVMAAKGAALPNVTATVDYSRVDPNRLSNLNGVTFGSPTAWDAGITARQTVYNAAVSAGVKASVAARQAAVADFEATVQSALLNVREQFLSVLLARSEVDVQEESVKLLEEELATAKAHVQAGSGSPFEQLRAEVALANGQPPLIRARNNYRLAAVELLRAIGLPAEEGVENHVVGELKFEGKEHELTSLLASGHANRPELRQLDRIIVLRRAAVDEAKAGGRPTVGVYAGYGIQKSNFSDKLGDTVQGWAIGLNGTWAVWDGNSTRGRVAQAQSQLQQARLSFDETALAVDAEIRQAYSSYREAEDLVNASHRVVDQATESLRLARSRYDAGAGTQLDVLQSQVALTEAKTNEASAYYEAGVALARLEHAASMTPMPAGMSVDSAK